MKEGSAQNRGRVKEETQRCYSRIPSHSACPGFVSRSHLQAPATAHGPPPGTRAQRVCVGGGGHQGLGTHALRARTSRKRTRSHSLPHALFPHLGLQVHGKCLRLIHTLLHSHTLHSPARTCTHLHVPRSGTSAPLHTQADTSIPSAHPHSHLLTHPPPELPFRPDQVRTHAGAQAHARSPGACACAAVTRKPGLNADAGVFGVRRCC
jgi:hypothetical protein